MAAAADSVTCASDSAVPQAKSFMPKVRIGDRQNPPTQRHMFVRREKGLFGRTSSEFSGISPRRHECGVGGRCHDSKVTATGFADDHRTMLARFQSGEEIFVWGHDTVTGDLWHLDEDTAVERRTFVNERIVCPVPGCGAAGSEEPPPALDCRG